jgi:hypothetical protein
MKEYLRKAIQKSGVADKIEKINLNNELDLKKDFDLLRCALFLIIIR